MNASELIARFRALHPRFNGYVQESIDAGWFTEREDIDFNICSTIHRCLCQESHLFDKTTLASFGALIEEAMTKGDNFVDTAVSTAIVESFCHDMNHKNEQVLFIAPHLGPKAFEQIERYSKAMLGPDEKSWDWVDFLKDHHISWPCS